MSNLAELFSKGGIAIVYSNHCCRWVEVTVFSSVILERQRIGNFLPMIPIPAPNDSIMGFPDAVKM